MNTPIVTELFEINTFVQNAIEVARNEAGENCDHDPWATAYGLVFSKNCSQRADALFKQLNVEFDYYDPDTSYEEEVEAFASALNNSCQQIAVFYPSVAQVYFPNLKTSGKRSTI